MRDNAAACSFADCSKSFITSMDLCCFSIDSKKLSVGDFDLLSGSDLAEEPPFGCGGDKMLLRLGDFGDLSILGFGDLGTLDFGERSFGEDLIGVLGDICGDFGDRGLWDLPPGLTAAPVKSKIIKLCTW